MTESRGPASRRKRALLVSYHFPPSLAVGGLRAANFSRHLPDFGWEPIVLTMADNSTEPAEKPGSGATHVVRTRAWPTLSDAYNAAKKMGKSRDAGSAAPAPPAAGGSVTAGNHGVLQTMRRWILSMLSLPDAERGWIIPAVNRAVELVREERVDVLITSSPPYSVHVVGLLTASITGIPWIADFRDPWMTGGRKSLFVTSKLSLAIDRWLERKAVRRANLAIGNTPALTECLRAGYPGEPASKFITITNSVDMGRFAPLWSIPKDSTFTITYAGSLYFGRSPEPVFAAARNLLDAGVISPADLRIVLVGECDDVDGVPTADIARRYNVGDMVSILPPVSYQEALEMIRRSHLALLLAPAQPNQVPAKAYDYIGLGTEILAIAGEGATANLIRENQVGAVFAPDDVQGMTAFLRDAFGRRGTVVAVPPPAASSFDARRNTERLAALLDSVAVKETSTRNA